MVWRERRWRVRGSTPVGLPERFVELEDVESGEWAQAPLGELEPEGEPGGTVLPLRPRSGRHRRRGRP